MKPLREQFQIYITVCKFSIISSDFHTYNTRWSDLGYVVVHPYNTKLYEKNSVNIRAVYSCNYLQKLNENNFFYQLSSNRLNIIIKNLFLNSYN